MTEGQTSNPPSLKRLMLITLGAAVAATVISIQWCFQPSSDAIRRG